MNKQNCLVEVTEAQKNIEFSKNKYQVKFETSMGDITLDLYADKAPIHAKNIIGLAKVGYYDGLTFHRVIPNFVIQGGCSVGNGTGDAGYKIKAEFNDYKSLNILPPHHVDVSQNLKSYCTFARNIALHQLSYLNPNTKANA